MGAALIARVVPPAALGRGRARRLVERNLMVYRRSWLIIVSGFFEPLFYLLSIGIGIGKLVGHVTGPGGTPLSYKAFVAPALLASSAMNGAVYDSTMNVFFKLKYAKVYDAVLSTPVGVGDVAIGEITWALMRGVLYSTAFLIIMAALGDVSSAWALLALPMFLFSTTFYPLSTYPRWLQLVVECTPLYHGVSMLRGLCTGAVGPSMLVDAAYLVVMGLIGAAITSRRLAGLLLK
jgi:lipooligosaccharide transport system permease protein